VQDLVAEHINPRDRAALQYLQDVRWTKGMMGFFLEFFFDENPFFYNKVAPHPSLEPSWRWLPPAALLLRFC
jgi:hypothetical protein